MLQMRRTRSLQIRMLPLEDTTLLAFRQCKLQRFVLLVCSWKARIENTVDAKMCEIGQKGQSIDHFRVQAVRSHLQKLSEPNEINVLFFLLRGTNGPTLCVVVAIVSFL